jgi:Sec-independent protein secretion pathway component TatC
VSEQNNDNSEVGSNDEVRPLIDHFLEARGRIFLTIIMFIFAFSASYNFIDSIIINLFDVDGSQLITLRTNLKLSFFISYFLTFIVFFLQARQFIVPGLRNEEISYVNKLFLHIISLFIISHMVGFFFSIMWLLSKVVDHNLYINHTITISLLTAAISFIPVIIYTLHKIGAEEILQYKSLMIHSILLLFLYPFTPLFEEKKFIGCVFSKVH